MFLLILFFQLLYCIILYHYTDASNGYNEQGNDANFPILRWSQLSVMKDTTAILNVTGGDVYQGRLLAILGPSGSGKLHRLSLT